MSLFALERKKLFKFVVSHFFGLLLLPICVELRDFYDAVLNLETMKSLVLVCSAPLLLFVFSCDHINDHICEGLHMAYESQKLDFESQTAAFAQKWCVLHSNLPKITIFVADAGF